MSNINYDNDETIQKLMELMHAKAYAHLVDSIIKKVLQPIMSCETCKNREEKDGYLKCNGCNFCRGRIVSKDFFCKCWKEDKQ